MLLSLVMSMRFFLFPVAMIVTCVYNFLFFHFLFAFLYNKILLTLINYQILPRNAAECLINRHCVCVFTTELVPLFHCAFH